MEKGNPMKRYRPTKITVKTRETVSLVKKGDENNIKTVCPICCSPLSSSFPVPESSAVASQSVKRTAELPTAENFDNQFKK